MCNICIALHKFEYSAGVADWRPFPTDGFQSVQDSSVRKEERVWGGGVFLLHNGASVTRRDDTEQRRQLVTGRLPAGPEQHPPLRAVWEHEEIAGDWTWLEMLWGAHSMSDSYIQQRPGGVSRYISNGCDLGGLTTSVWLVHSITRSYLFDWYKTELSKLGKWS